MDCFAESPVHDFTESQLHERESGPDCPAVGITDQFLTWPTLSGYPGESNPTYPYGHWRVHLDLTITAPSTYSLIFPEYYHWIHFILTRAQDSVGGALQCIYPTPVTNAKVGTVLRPYTYFWGMPDDFPVSYYAPDYQTLDLYRISPLAIPDFKQIGLYPQSNEHRNGFFYTWRFSALDSETYPKTYSEELLIKKPTPWCASRFYPIQFSAGATYNYSLRVTRET